MAQARLSVRKIREVLRLKSEARLSDRQIAAVHQSLNDNSPLAEPLVPAVPVRRSVRPDYVICLECGYRRKCFAAISTADTA